MSWQGEGTEGGTSPRGSSFFNKYLYSLPLLARLHFPLEAVIAKNTRSTTMTRLNPFNDLLGDDDIFVHLAADCMTVYMNRSMGV
ncbi:hypothetical protein Nepgr_028093 [Nepenthes gracilis]|uniref:Uncharacterized protein n=1 Tax=Nepenthes gracilis TaxID=150966 RepID=A0AAD3Y3L4_NEPGR|nr:hypothetical protein Nepgr_028093 [Nepenthes gracilis]